MFQAFCWNSTLVFITDELPIWRIYKTRNFVLHKSLIPLFPIKFFPYGGLLLISNFVSFSNVKVRKSLMCGILQFSEFSFRYLILSMKNPILPLGPHQTKTNLSNLISELNYQWCSCFYSLLFVTIYWIVRCFLARMDPFNCIYI